MKDISGAETENTDIYGCKLNKEGYRSVTNQLADKSLASGEIKAQAESLDKTELAIFKDGVTL